MTEGCELRERLEGDDAGLVHRFPSFFFFFFFFSLSLSLYICCCVFVIGADIYFYSVFASSL